MHTHKFKFYLPEHGTRGPFTLLDIIENIDVYDDLDDLETIQRQFTGRLDVLNVEIYDGDILHCIGPRCNFHILVKWCNDKMEWIGFDAKSGISINLTSWLFGKAIGNIHENPELLEAAP